MISKFVNLLKLAIADGVLAAQLRNRNIGLVHLQNPDNLLFANCTASFLLSSLLGRSQLQYRLGCRGKINLQYARDASSRERIFQSRQSSNNDKDQNAKHHKY